MNSTSEFLAESISSRADSFLRSLPPWVRADVEGKMQELKWHEQLGLLKPEMYFGKRVLDWEAGLGGFSAAFYCLGASKVVAIDSWVDPANLPEALTFVDGIDFLKVSAENFAATYGDDLGPFDLIFSNTVTEHISDLPSAFTVLHGLLQDQGTYLNVHDNYYSPCGSHDHGFWFYGASGSIDFQGTACWTSSQKCESSAAHRDMLLTRMPWTWNDRLDSRRNPDDCATCPYFKRGQPWPHLAYVNEFPETFDDPSFLTWKPGSSLNKVTTFQVRQLLREAGFKINGFHRNRCTNSPPEELLDQGFSELELTTTTSVWSCSKV